MKNHQIILGLGSNIGNRQANLDAAIVALGDCVKNIRISSVMETKALLPENAPESWDMAYLNMAIAGDTPLPPHELLAKIKQIEQNLGRVKLGHWSPRNIDIDILAMDNLVIDEPDLTIPHKELLNRDFALKPLLELMPDWVYPTKIVGILNITPDSFSDGGQNFAPEKAIAAMHKLIEEGAEIIDIGAESTRPNATPITPEEEWARLAPILAVRDQFPAIISVDTRNAQTAQKALEFGADWINDVSGFASPDMIAAVQHSDCKIVVMHSLTVPADKSVVMPETCDPVAEIFAWANNRIKSLENAGIARNHIIFDVGIGFGKAAQQSKKLIEEILQFKKLGVPLLVGHSRKSFLGAKNLEDADQKTLEISKFLVKNGVDYLRVHNVKIHKNI